MKWNETMLIRSHIAAKYSFSFSLWFWQTCYLVIHCTSVVLKQSQIRTIWKESFFLYIYLTFLIIKCNSLIISSILRPSHRRLVGPCPINPFSVAIHLSNLQSLLTFVRCGHEDICCHIVSNQIHRRANLRLAMISSSFGFWYRMSSDIKKKMI
jgi:hypothetical protein